MIVWTWMQETSMTRTVAAMLLTGSLAIAQGIPSPGSGQPATAQPGGVPAMPVAAVPITPTQALAKLPENLQNHLKEWEKRTSIMQTLYTECEREVKNTLTQKSSQYKGAIRCMKPNLAYLRIDNLAKKEDFQAYICDGRFVYAYQGIDKKMMTRAIPPGGKNNVGDNLLLEFMSGVMTAGDVALRFQLALLKEDQHYVYIQVVPTLKKDQQEFESMILVLFSGNVKGVEYLPAKVQMKNQNGQEVEEWTFKQPLINPAGIKAADFVYIKPPSDWKIEKDGVPNK
jgi:TIGR03009 family protein